MQISTTILFITAIILMIIAFFALLSAIMIDLEKSFHGYEWSDMRNHRNEILVNGKWVLNGRESSKKT